MLLHGLSGLRTSCGREEADPPALCSSSPLARFCKADVESLLRVRRLPTGIFAWRHPIKRSSMFAIRATYLFVSR